MAEHGNAYEKWKIIYDKSTNRFQFSNIDKGTDYHNLFSPRDTKKDLVLYLKRLNASDDSVPVTIRNNTYSNMADEILDGSDPYVYIRKGQWSKSVLKIDYSEDEIKVLQKAFKESGEDNFDDFILKNSKKDNK